jgi:hypothetical protein
MTYGPWVGKTFPMEAAATTGGLKGVRDCDQMSLTGMLDTADVIEARHDEAGRR